MRPLLLVAALSSLLIAAPAAAQCTLTVTTSLDGGPGSLRQAIADANATEGLDIVCFDIPGDGPHTIQPQSALPTIVQPIVLDGYTQPGASENTLVVGNDAVLMIEIDGSEAGGGAEGLTLGGSADGSVLRGLVINRFGDHGVFLNGSIAAPIEDVVVEGNFIGTDVTGTMALGNANGHFEGGAYITHAIRARIGGEAPAARNLISGHYGTGIILFTGAVGTMIENNYIGTDAAGMASIPNNRGIRLDRGVEVTTIRGNVISGNTENPGGGSMGIFIAGAVHPVNTVIQGNLIGVAADGATPLGNEGHGIAVNSSGDAAAPIIIGGTGPGEGNIIAYNGAQGILLTHGDPGNPILGNAIYENGGLGIRLDNGTNNRQNFPDIVGSTIDGDGNLLVSYHVDSDPAGSAYPIHAEFFIADVDEQEGQVYLGFDAYTETDWSGCGSAPCVKTTSLGTAAALGITDGDPLLATATDAEGNTSEFSARAHRVANESAIAASGAFTLHPPHPNPFTGHATIGFDLPEAAPVQLTVHDILGRRVVVLVDAMLSPGRHEARLDADRLSAGIYLVHLRAGQYSETQRVVRVR